MVVSDTKGNEVTFPDVAPSGGLFTTAPMDVSGLVDGTLTATPTFTVPQQSPFVGATLTITKDVNAPPAPIAKTAPGALPGTKTVTLADDDGTAAIHYTVVGNAPSSDSPTYVSPITITDTTTIRAIAIDRAGNESPAAAFTVTFPDAAGGSGSTPPPTGGTITIVQQVPFPSPALPGPPGPAGPAAQAIQAVTATSLPAVRGLSVAVLRGHALRLAIRLGPGAGVVRLRVFRTSHGRATGRPVLSTLRLPSAGGLYVATLRAHALRALRPGRYVVEARAGAGAGRYGAPVRVGFTVH